MVRYGIRVKCTLIVPTLILVCLTSGADAQVITIGPSKGSNPKAYCEEVEPLAPNLVLKQDTRMTGRITDQTRDPFGRSAIELRRFITSRKQVSVKKVSTDDEGNFSVGVVMRGKYRLLLSPSRAFKQPEKLECTLKECTLNSMLIVNPTDQLTTNCPIR